MLETAKENQVLLTKIREKRKEIAHYLRKMEPRNAGLMNASIICGALAAAITAGPGVGGEGFIDSAKNIFSTGIPIWQLLCIVASILSVSAVIANGMLKSHSLSTKLSSTRACDAKLEGLELMLELDQVEVKQATQIYTQCLSEIPHI